ncbi:MAG: sugar ABC transporter permease [Clostridia bacterium]|nr:sugar ABC transporter permease [Clostridia bacterium]
MISRDNSQVHLKRGMGAVRFKQSIPYILLSLPAMIYLAIFNYWPMFGIVLAFKDYKIAHGIFGSRWVGLKNFEYFFTTNDLARVLGNTILYNLVFLVVIGLFFGMFFALILYEIRSKFFNKLYQTAMLLPFFLSYVIITAITYMFLSPSSGFLNTVLQAFGASPIKWYNEPVYWPFILVFVESWKQAGFASLYFYSALLSIDTSLFEAASLDGASRIRQIWHISLPELRPMACITIIMRLGSIFGSDFGLFYQIPMDQATLYPATDVLSTYMLRGLQDGSFGTTAAIGTFTGVVGLILVLGSNAIIKKISPENSMF